MGGGGGLNRFKGVGLQVALKWGGGVATCRPWILVHAHHMQNYGSTACTRVQKKEGGRVKMCVTYVRRLYLGLLTGSSTPSLLCRLFLFRRDGSLVAHAYFSSWNLRGEKPTDLAAAAGGGRGVEFTHGTTCPAR